MGEFKVTVATCALVYFNVNFIFIFMPLYPVLKGVLLVTVLTLLQSRTSAMASLASGVYR